MFQLQNVLVSEEIFSNNFICNLSACKGACCVEGDSGAPLEEGELAILEEVYPIVKPFLRIEGIEVIEAQGTSVTTPKNTHETPLVNNKECAYVIFDDHGTSLCGIEEAYNSGVISFKKPISCHLYPIRTVQLKHNIAVNYDRWDICSDACTLGMELGVPVFKFLKQALVRKFGEQWYKELEEVAARYNK